MGSDLGPSVIVAGMAKSARRNAALRFIVHGDRPELERLIERRRGPVRTGARSATPKP